MMQPTEAEKRAEAQVREAMRLFVEARQELTRWRLQQFVAREIDSLGGVGFVSDIGDVLRSGAYAAKPRAVGEE